MKKFLMAIFALAVATTVATAAVNISWTAGQWGENHLGDGSGSGNAILDDNSVLWQLIYAGADDAIDAIPSGSVPGATDAYGDDDVWAYRTIAQGGGTAAEDGSTWDNWLTYQSGTFVYTDGAWDAAGYVYQRVFESSTPGNGTWYYESELTSMIIFDPANPPTTTLSYVNENAAFVPDQQVTQVPEPATMSLLGLGALVMAIRRRRS